MCSVSERIKNRIHLFRNIRVAWPYVRRRNHKVLCKCTISVDTDALCVLAVFFVAFQTVPTFAACDVSLAGYQISDLKSLYARTYLDNFTNILMSGGQSYRDRMLCPFIPLINMYVCTADSCFVDFDLYIVWSYFRNRYSLHP